MSILPLSQGEIDDHPDSLVTRLFMRRTLRAVGFVKAAHYRRGWPTHNGRLLDAVGYAVLRTDWRDRTTTPVDWNDEPDTIDGPIGV